MIRLAHDDPILPEDHVFLQRSREDEQRVVWGMKLALDVWYETCERDGYHATIRRRMAGAHEATVRDASLPVRERRRRGNQHGTYRSVRSLPGEVTHSAP